MIVKSLKYFTHAVFYIMSHDMLPTCYLITVLASIVVISLTLGTDILYRDLDKLITRLMIITLSRT